MQFGFAFLATAFASLVVGNPTLAPRDIPASSCTTGPLLCCNIVQRASDPQVSPLLGVLGINLQDTNVVVRINCFPLTNIRVSSGTCYGIVVCCEDDSYGNLLAISCTPVQL
ncbi:hypothetical protein GYMLUDRAFT_178469 [Collybiopsis luxurians FD-317 M1]|uniref:Hydrophobin n=1 Tax=Collybiopsis luxurians FD-317 M1 TaxID=944289 RepID=A0A0D0CFL8_9AGAR|nr:hypothetical protein GYMLUDRAFT_178469 [Collybiopsis luxurians FD-317 M1]